MIALKAIGLSLAVLGAAVAGRYGDFAPWVQELSNGKIFAIIAVGLILFGVAEVWGD